MTTDELRDALWEIRAELKRAPDIVQDLELAAERDELMADGRYDRALLNATGNVEERKAYARVQSQGERDAANVSRAAYNRARLKVRLLESEVMALQSLLKSVQSET